MARKTKSTKHILESSDFSSGKNSHGRKFGDGTMFSLMFWFQCELHRKLKLCITWRENLGAELVEEWLEGSNIDQLPCVPFMVMLMWVSTSHPLFVQWTYVAHMLCPGCLKGICICAVWIWDVTSSIYKYELKCYYKQLFWAIGLSYPGHITHE